jgi:hypothetical protein
MAFLTELEKTLKFTWKYERPSRDKAILIKKNDAGRITIADFKLYFSSILQ